MIKVGGLKDIETLKLNLSPLPSMKLSLILEVDCSMT